MNVILCVFGILSLLVDKRRRVSVRVVVLQKWQQRNSKMKIEMYGDQSMRKERLKGKKKNHP